MDYIALGKTLQEARIALGLKQSDIAEQLGCTSANISSWERGKSKIDIDSFAELCKIYHIDFSKTLERLNPIQSTYIEQLDFSEQEHIKKYRILDEYGKKAVDGLLNTEYDRCTYLAAEQELIHLPKSVLKASAGSGNWLDEQQLESVSVLDTPQSRKANLVIEVDGDSMSPTYENGDNVLVNTKSDVAVGDIGIFIVDNSGYIKKLGTDRLISVNPEYEDIFPTEYSDFRCVGKVLGKAEIVE